MARKDDTYRVDIDERSIEVIRHVSIRKYYNSFLNERVCPRCERSGLTSSIYTSGLLCHNCHLLYCSDGELDQLVVCRAVPTPYHPIPELTIEEAIAAIEADRYSDTVAAVETGMQ